MFKMFNETFLDCLAYPGIVGIATSSKEGKAHIENTWSKYILITEKEELLIPCDCFEKTKKNIDENNYVEISVANADVLGEKGYGAGFLITGQAKFVEKGYYYDVMNAKCPNIKQVMVVNPISIKQTI